jgi:hypothetical protein
MFYLFDRVEERSIPRHEGTPAQTPDEATIAHRNIMLRQFPPQTALALFQQGSLNHENNMAHVFDVGCAQLYTQSITIV